MIDFLTFKSFITPFFLIVFYYIGAVIIPIFSFLFILWIRDRYFLEFSLRIKKILKDKISFVQRVVFIALFIFSFLAMEIFWRMIFEFMIAYFDMHDALMRLTIR